MRGPRKRLTGHEVVTVMGEAAGSAQRKIFKIVQTDAGGFFGLTEWEGLPMAQLEAVFTSCRQLRMPTLPSGHLRQIIFRSDPALP